MHLAIWTHRNDKVIFLKHQVNANAIKNDFCHKLTTFLEVKKAQDIEYGLIDMWNLVQDNM